MTDEDQGGRIFFSSTGRTLEGEDEAEGAAAEAVPA